MFKTPVDKQQVMTLARNMYPDNSQQLIFEAFEYLLINLKLTTSESDVNTDMSVKEDKPNTPLYLQECPREEKTHLNSSGEVKIPTSDNIDKTFYSPLGESESTQENTKDKGQEFRAKDKHFGIILLCA